MAPQVSLASPVASQGKACARHFDQLCALFEDNERQFIYEISHLRVCDSYGQFKIWAGNIGALQTIQSTSSLDYRLREVPKVSKQVVSLLQDLDEALEDVIAIASGERENRVSSPVPFDAELLGDDATNWSETVTEPSGPAAEPASEIQEIFQSIPETIASLFKLSILIRNSSSRDRYAKALAAAWKTPFDDQFDIDHVGNKFPCLYHKDRDWLRKRLGKAITQKRQYLHYCREHHEKLSKVPESRNLTEALSETKMSTTFLGVQGQQSEGVDDVQTVVSRPTSTLAPTTASTVIPAKLETAESVEKLEEQNEDDNRSQTSYATSVGEDENDNRLSVVRLEEVAGTTQPFECPYCWTIQRINNQHAWRKHVMRDLKPYVCTSEECDMKLFPDRHTWFTHELQNHLVEWKCCFCSHAPYQTRDQFDKHVRKIHADKFTEDQLPDLVKVCQKPVDKLPPTACPFCDEWEARLRELNKYISEDEILVVTPQQFRHHVGSHMEQLALFAIPRGYKEDGDAGSSRAAPGHGSDASSDRSLLRPDYEDEDNPRLHVAAFEGLLEEVKLLLDDDPTQVIKFGEGSTWGSALAAAAAGGHIDIAELCLPREPQTGTVAFDSVNHLPRSKSSGWGPLHWAASNGHLPMTDFLIENGISMLEKAFDGSTAADLARRHGHGEIVQILEGIKQKPSDTPRGPGFFLNASQQQTQHNLRITIFAADGLIKRDVFSFPDPFAVLSVNGNHTKTIGVIKRTLNPYWNECFNLRVTDESIINVSIFDMKKFKKKDQGFLGFINFRVGEFIVLGSKTDRKVNFDLRKNSGDASVSGTLHVYLSTDLDNHPQGTLSSTTSSAPPNTTINPSNKSNFTSVEDAQGLLPPLWERMEDNLVRTYYADHNTKTTTWIRPGDVPLSTASPSAETTTPLSIKRDTTALPPMWEKRTTPGGRDYFIDHSTRKTTWIDPRK